MISVIIPTFNSADTLTSTFAALVGPMVNGVVREVIVSDGGSHDDTALIADAAGATFIKGPKGRGVQLRAGAEKAKSDWLLFLHSDTVLSSGWDEEAAGLIDEIYGRDEPLAASFRFALDDHSLRARFLESLVAFRCAVLKLPYGDQGLLISRRFYDKLGGFADLNLMEDVDIVRRIGRKNLVMFRARATTSAIRYKRDGYVLRVLRNTLLMSLYLCRVPPRVLARFYG